MCVLFGKPDLDVTGLLPPHHHMEPAACAVPVYMGVVCRFVSCSDHSWSAWCLLCHWFSWLLVCIDRLFCWGFWCAVTEYSVLLLISLTCYPSLEPLLFPTGLVLCLPQILQKNLKIKSSSVRSGRSVGKSQVSQFKRLTDYWLATSLKLQNEIGTIVWHKLFKKTTKFELFPNHFHSIWSMEANIIRTD